MSAFTGLATGFIGLAALEAILSSSQSVGRVGGVLTSVNSVFERLADPTIPLIPDRSAASDVHPGGSATMSSLPGVPQLTPATTVPATVSL